MPSLILEQLHIDVVRNATDDFNPFHDPHRWHNIRANPFAGPIALGFQLAGLALDRISQYRRSAGEGELAAANGLHFSNYQFTFASAVTANSELEVQVRKTANRIGARGELSNRVTLKHDGKLALMGMRRDTREPATPLTPPPGLPSRLDGVADHTMIPASEHFLTRKYLMTSNGKNFCADCFIPQHHYFDELAERIYSPLIHPVTGLLRTARARLVGRARLRGPALYLHQPQLFLQQAAAATTQEQRRHPPAGQRAENKSGSSPNRVGSLA